MGVQARLLGLAHVGGHDLEQGVLALGRDDLVLERDDDVLLCDDLILGRHGLGGGVVAGLRGVVRILLGHVLDGAGEAVDLGLAPAAHSGLDALIALLHELLDGDLALVDVSLVLGPLLLEDGPLRLEIDLFLLVCLGVALEGLDLGFQLVNPRLGRLVHGHVSHVGHDQRLGVLQGFREVLDLLAHSLRRRGCVWRLGAAVGRRGQLARSAEPQREGPRALADRECVWVLVEDDGEPGKRRMGDSGEEEEEEEREHGGRGNLDVRGAAVIDDALAKAVDPEKGEEGADVAGLGNEVGENYGREGPINGCRHTLHLERS